MNLSFYFSDMKFLTIVFLFISRFSFSQEIDCPVKNGVTYYNESYDFRTKRDCWNIYRGSYQNPSTNVHSENPISVISVSEGKVYSVIFTGDLLSVLVRKGDNEFYVYGYLSSINVKKGDEVKIGDKIGEINKKSEFSDDGDYILDFQYWQKTEPINVFDQLKCIKK